MTHDFECLDDTQPCSFMLDNEDVVCCLLSDNIHQHKQEYELPGDGEGFECGGGEYNAVEHGPQSEACKSILQAYSLTNCRKTCHEEQKP